MIFCMRADYPYDQILLYLNGQLEGEELHAFEQQMSKDKKLRKEVDLNKEIQLAVQDTSLTALEEKIATADRVFHDTKPKQPFLTWTAGTIWLGLAASVLIIIAAFIWFAGKETRLDPGDLYEQYAFHEFTFSERGANNQLARAESLLNSESYEQAIPVLEEYLAKFPNDAEVQLANGITHMEAGYFDKAIQIFSQLEEDHPIFKNECQWYKALVHLKRETPVEALPFLLEIDPTSNRYQSARKLAAEIEGMTE